MAGLASLFLLCCRKDSGTPAQQVTLSFSVVNTRATGLGTPGGGAYESFIRDLVILIFKDERLWQITEVGSFERVPGSEGSYKFKQNVPRTASPVVIHIVANSGYRTKDLEFLYNHTEEEVRAAFPSVMVSTDGLGVKGPFPMWGRVNVPSGLLPSNDGGPVQIKNFPLLRSVAKAVIIKHDDLKDEQFEIKSVFVYRINNRIAPVPLALNHDLSQNLATAPSVPLTSLVVHARIRIDVSAHGAVMYLSESVKVPAANEKWIAASTVIVVGGSFKKGKETFYRIDIKGGGKDGEPFYYGELVRNHIYTFKIDKVESEGCSTPDGAAFGPGCGSPWVSAWVYNSQDLELGEGGQVWIKDWVNAAHALHIGEGPSDIVKDWIRNPILNANMGHGADIVKDWTKNPDTKDPNLGQGAGEVVKDWDKRPETKLPDVGKGAGDVVKDWDKRPDTHLPDMGQGAGDVVKDWNKQPGTDTDMGQGGGEVVKDWVKKPATDTDMGEGPDTLVKDWHKMPEIIIDMGDAPDN